MVYVKEKEVLEIDFIVLNVLAKEVGGILAFIYLIIKI